MQNDNLKMQLLNDELQLLVISVHTLKLSVEKCQKIGFDKDYSFEEMESFDSLTSKFGRTSDLYTQKVLKTIWILLHEPFGPYIDLMNKAEKMGIINSADQLIEIRDLRNQITHEYLPEAISEIVPEVIEKCRELFNNIEFTKQFITGRGWII